jgi:hypothetical protein
MVHLSCGFFSLISFSFFGAVPGANHRDAVAVSQADKGQVF